MGRTSGETFPQLLVREQGHYNELKLNVLKLNYVLQELESLSATLPKVLPPEYALLKRFNKVIDFCNTY